MNINTSAASVRDLITEMVGIKTGLVISAVELTDLLARELSKVDSSDWYYSPADWLHAPANAWVRLRPDDLESLVVRVMYIVGALPDCLTSDQLLFRFGQETPSYLDQLPPVEDEDVFPPMVRPQMRFQWLIGECLASGEAPDELRDLLREYQHRSIFTLFFSPPLNWDGKANLVDLFHLTDLGGPVEADSSSPPLIDQLFIDYLQAQPEDLVRMDWRQFEYLTGEWFRRLGYRVMVTPPGHDGGVDLRAVKDESWPGPELVLVQAKRFGSGREVGIETVKALWTDVNDESATRGIVATTSVLAKGAREFCEARQYRLTVIERETVSKWIHALAQYPRD